VTTLYKKKFMAININTIYQRVLTIANKEQRGYITPQEFNVLANAVQVDIFEQYFYDLSQFMRRQGNDTRHADVIDSIEEKISLFEKNNTSSTYNPVNGSHDLPSDLYKMSSVTFNSVEVENSSLKNLKYILASNLTLPTNTQPIYIKNSDGIIVYGAKSTSPYYEKKTTGVTMDYIAKPATVKWGFIMVNNEPLYDANTSTNFELHNSEQRNLVNKILELAGVSMKAGDVYQAVDKEDMENLQNEKI